MNRIDSNNSVNSENSPMPKLINAEIIHKYFHKCGKMIKLDNLKDLMTDCGEQLGLEDFNGEAQISFELFHKFMTFLLEKSGNNEKTE